MLFLPFHLRQKLCGPRELAGGRHPLMPAARHPLAHGPDNLARLGARILRCLLNEPILHVWGKADDDLGQVPTSHV